MSLRRVTACCIDYPVVVVVTQELLRSQNCCSMFSHVHRCSSSCFHWRVLVVSRLFLGDIFENISNEEQVLCITGYFISLLLLAFQTCFLKIDFVLVLAFCCTVNS